LDAAFVGTPTVAAVYESFYYSWYNPDLLVPEDVSEDGSCVDLEEVWSDSEGVWYDACHTINCWNFDIDAGQCISRMASGEDFRAYFGKALACSSDYELGTVFRVIIPDSLAGDWVCLDRGGAVGGRMLDFLQREGVLEWNTMLEAQVINP
jgi:hypothetical protein